MASGRSENLVMIEPGLSPPPMKKVRNQEEPAASLELMEERIWKEFPEDLFEAVIARLPITTFFRFRSVCQKWNSILCSQSFSRQCVQVERTQPWFYALTRESINTSGAMLYDPSTKKWHHPAAPPLPTGLVVFPVASAGGLVCFLDASHRSFYISNPLTRSFKELPARSVKILSGVALGMTLNGRNADSGYKLIWVGCEGKYQVYESTKNSWIQPRIAPSNIKLPLVSNSRSQAVSVHETLYFMRSDPEGLVSYNTESGIWKQFAIPCPPHLRDCTLAECGGRIILVGLLTKNAATCVCIWELQKMTLLWKEVDRMPNLWCLEFYGKHVRMTCLGNKGLLMLSLRSRKMNRLATYEFSSREWVEVPGCALPCGRRKGWIACGAAFHPCLTASA